MTKLQPMKKFVINSGKKFVSKIKNGLSRIKSRIDKTKKTFKDHLHEARVKKKLDIIRLFTDSIYFWDYNVSSCFPSYSETCS